MNDREYLKLNTSINTGSNAQDLHYNDEGNVEAVIELNLPDNIFRSRDGKRKVESVELQTSKMRLSMEDTPIAQLPLETDLMNDGLTATQCHLDVYPFCLLDDGVVKPDSIDDSAFPSYKNHQQNFIFYEVVGIDPDTEKPLSDRYIKDYLFLTKDASTLPVISNAGIHKYPKPFDIFTDIIDRRFHDQILNVCAQSNHEPYRIEDGTLFIKNISTLEQMFQDALESAITYASTTSTVDQSILLVSQFFYSHHPDAFPNIDTTNSYQVTYATRNDIYYFVAVDNWLADVDSNLKAACKPVVRFQDQSISIGYDTSSFDTLIPVLWNPTYVNTYDHPQQMTMNSYLDDAWQEPPPKRMYKFNVVLDESTDEFNYSAISSQSPKAFNILGDEEMRKRFSFLPWIEFHPPDIDEDQEYIIPEEKSIKLEYTTTLFNKAYFFNPDIQNVTVNLTDNQIQNHQLPAISETTGLPDFEYVYTFATIQGSETRDTNLRGQKQIRYQYYIRKSDYEDEERRDRIDVRYNQYVYYSTPSDDSFIDDKPKITALGYVPTYCLDPAVYRDVRFLRKNINESYTMNVDTFESDITETPKTEANFTVDETVTEINTSEPQFSYTSIQSDGENRTILMFLCRLQTNDDVPQGENGTYFSWIPAIVIPGVMSVPPGFNGQIPPVEPDSVSEEYDSENERYEINEYWNADHYFGWDYTTEHNSSEPDPPWLKYIYPYQMPGVPAPKRSYSLNVQNYSPTPVKETKQIVQTFENLNLENLTTTKPLDFKHLTVETEGRIKKEIIEINFSSSSSTPGYFNPDAEIPVTAYSYAGENTTGVTGIEDGTYCYVYQADLPDSSFDTVISDVTDFPFNRRDEFYNQSFTRGQRTDRTSMESVTPIELSTYSTSKNATYSGIQFNRTSRSVIYLHSGDSISFSDLEEEITEPNLSLRDTVYEANNFDTNRTLKAIFWKNNDPDAGPLLWYLGLSPKGHWTNNFATWILDPSSTPTNFTPLAITVDSEDPHDITIGSSTIPVRTYKIYWKTLLGSASVATCLHFNSTDSKPIYQYKQYNLKTIYTTDTNVTTRQPPNIPPYYVEDVQDIVPQLLLDGWVLSIDPRIAYRPNIYNSNNKYYILDGTGANINIGSTELVKINDDYYGNVFLNFIWDNLPLVVLSPITSIVLQLSGVDVNQEIQPVNRTQTGGSTLTASIPIIENFYTLAQSLRDLHDELVVVKDTIDDVATYKLSPSGGQERNLRFKAQYITKDGKIHQIYIPPNGVFSLQLTFAINYYST